MGTVRRGRAHSDGEDRYRGGTETWLRQDGAARQGPCRAAAPRPGPCADVCREHARGHGPAFNLLWWWVAAWDGGRGSSWRIRSGRRHDRIVVVPLGWRGTNETRTAACHCMARPRLCILPSKQALLIASGPCQGRSGPARFDRGSPAYWRRFLGCSYTSSWLPVPCTSHSSLPQHILPPPFKIKHWSASRSLAFSSRLSLPPHPPMPVLGTTILSLIHHLLI